MTEQITLENKNYLQSLSINQLEEAFLHSLDIGNLELIKFMLNSPELKENIDIHMKEDYSFKYLVGHSNINNNYIKLNEERYSILMYLIFDYHIDLNKRIKKCLTYYPEIIKMFEVRDSYNKLEESIENKEIAKTKITKIKKL